MALHSPWGWQKAEVKKSGRICFAVSCHMLGSPLTLGEEKTALAHHLKPWHGTFKDHLQNSICATQSFLDTVKHLTTVWELYSKLKLGLLFALAKHRGGVLPGPTLHCYQVQGKKECVLGVTRYVPGWREQAWSHLHRLFFPGRLT